MKLLGPRDGRTRVPLNATEWASRIRRVLLVAHVLPAIFGLVAVTLLTRDSDVRTIDIAVWCVVVIWDLFLLGIGWRRIGGNVRLAPWVIADALVLSTLVFIGTPARTVVVYAAVEGALFAAVFVSAKVALGQVAIVYGALAAAGIARAMGSDLPSPNTGWLLPLIVTLVGVMALYFLGIALGDLEDTSAGIERAIKERGQALNHAHREDLEARSIGEITAKSERRIGDLADQIDRYREAIRGRPGEESNARALEVISKELHQALDARLATAIQAQHAHDLSGAVQRGIQQAVGARVLGIDVRFVADPDLDGAQLAPEQGAVVRDIVREATNNAAVHGQGPITVSATMRDERTVIDIHDCGEGYDPAEVPPSIGTFTMHENAISIGADLSHDIEEGGHRVRLTLPPARVMV